MAIDYPLGRPANNPPTGWTTVTATIANGASLSGSVDCLGLVPVAVLMPGTWTAANMTFQGSYDNSAFGNLYDSGGEISLAVAADVLQSLTPSSFAGCRYLKLRSGTAGAAVNQGGDRTLTVILRSFL